MVASLVVALQALLLVAMMMNAFPTGTAFILGNPTRATGKLADRRKPDSTTSETPVNTATMPSGVQVPQSYVPNVDTAIEAVLSLFHRLNDRNPNNNKVFTALGEGRRPRPSDSRLEHDLTPLHESRRDINDSIPMMALVRLKRNRPDLPSVDAILSEAALSQAIPSNLLSRRLEIIRVLSRAANGRNSPRRPPSSRRRTPCWRMLKKNHVPWLLTPADRRRCLEVQILRLKELARQLDKAVRGIASTHNVSDTRNSTSTDYPIEQDAGTKRIPADPEPASLDHDKRLYLSRKLSIERNLTVQGDLEKQNRLMQDSFKSKISLSQDISNRHKSIIQNNPDHSDSTINKEMESPLGNRSEVLYTAESMNYNKETLDISVPIRHETGNQGTGGDAINDSNTRRPVDTASTQNSDIKTTEMAYTGGPALSDNSSGELYQAASDAAGGHVPGTQTSRGPGTEPHGTSQGTDDDVDGRLGRQFGVLLCLGAVMLAAVVLFVVLCCRLCKHPPHSHIERKRA